MHSLVLAHGQALDAASAVLHKENNTANRLCTKGLPALELGSTCFGGEALVVI